MNLHFHFFVILPVVLPLLSPAFAAPPLNTNEPLNPATEQTIRQASVACQKGAVNHKDQLGWEKILGYSGPSDASDEFLYLYPACLKLADPQSKSCDEMRDLDSGFTASCLNTVGFAALAWRTFKQPGSSPCAASLGWPMMKGNSLVSPEERSALCPDVVTAIKSGQNKPLCEQAQSKGILPEKHSIDWCTNGPTLGMRGQPELCAASAANCREEAALVAALRSGGPQACAASPLCGALATHTAQACAPYARAASKTFCSKIAAARAALDKESSSAAAVAQRASVRDAQKKQTAVPQHPPQPADNTGQTLLRAQAAKVEAATREAAINRAAEEMAKHKMIVEERSRRAELLRKKSVPPKQFHHNQREQALPPSVLKQMQAIEAKSKGPPQQPPAAPTQPILPPPATQ